MLKKTWFSQNFRFLWIDFSAIYLNYKYSLLRVKYKCIILILSVGRCLVVTIKIFYSMLPQVATQFFQNWKNFKKSRKFLEKHDTRVEVFIDKFAKIWSFFKKLHVFWMSVERSKKQMSKSEKIKKTLVDSPQRNPWGVSESPLNFPGGVSTREVLSQINAVSLIKFLQREENRFHHLHIQFVQV